VVNGRKLWIFAMAGIPTVFAACGGDNLTLPSEGEPAHIEILAGNGQQAPVNSELPTDLLVRVTDTQNRPVQGATVEFVLQEDGGGGVVTPTSATTGADGQAATSITLGTQVGPLTGQARVPVDEGDVPVVTEFVATALSADANRIALVSGNEQSGPIGTTLGAPLVVQVTDGFGNPISDVPVQWTVTGGGDVTASTTQTDATGHTSVERILGSTAGQQTTLASANDLAGSPVIFTHTAIAGDASRVEKVSGDQQSAPPGTQVPNPLVVRVLDAENNPISGRAVEWVIAEGGGTPDPARSTTDDQGFANTRWALGPTPGRNRLNAVVSGVGVGRIEFTATAEKVASATSITSIAPGQSTIGDPVVVSFSVTGNGGIPSGTVTVNGENVAQPCTSTLSNGSGSCSISFTAPGNHRITATYSGDARFGGSSDEENHQVNAAPNLPPVASPDQYSTNEDEVLNVSASSGVLINDADLDNDALSAVKDTDPGHGTLAFNANGSFTYTPAPDYSGADSFTYHVSDGSGVSPSVTVTLTVHPVNDAPTAQNDAYNTPGGGQSLTVSAADGVLKNDSDRDGTIPSAQKSSDPTQGTVALNADGSFTYTPNSGAIGQDSFTYTITDGSLSSEPATVGININP
jgi:VCBS repeat-containing protein